MAFEAETNRDLEGIPSAFEPAFEQNQLELHFGHDFACNKLIPTIDDSVFAKYCRRCGFAWANEV